MTALKSSSSWEWKSILWGWKLLKKGVRWSNANGESVRVWDDPWLPNDCYLYPNEGESDRLIWHCTKSCNFKVKSGYHLANTLLLNGGNCGDGPGTSSLMYFKSFWNSLWSLWIKNKQKHFLRRCVLHSLPVKGVIAKRLRNLDDTCPVCGLEE